MVDELLPQRMIELERAVLERDSRLNLQKKEITNLKRQKLEIELQSQYRND